MANVSTQFSSDTDLLARHAAQSGNLSGSLATANLGRTPLPKSSSEELLALLDRAGGNRIPRLRGRGRARPFDLATASPELARLFSLLAQFKKL